MKGLSVKLFVVRHSEMILFGLIKEIVFTYDETRKWSMTRQSFGLLQLWIEKKLGCETVRMVWWMCDEMNRICGAKQFVRKGWMVFNFENEDRNWFARKDDWIGRVEHSNSKTIKISVDEYFHVAWIFSRSMNTKLSCIDYACFEWILSMKCDVHHSFHKRCH